MSDMVNGFTPAEHITLGFDFIDSGPVKWHLEPYPGDDATHVLIEYEHTGTTWQESHEERVILIGFEVSDSPPDACDCDCGGGGAWH